MDDKVWLAPPWGEGEPMEMDATPEVLVPLLTAGWNQCEPPTQATEVKSNVND